MYGDSFGVSCAAGIDSSVEVSKTRWDPDIYYDKNEGMGKTRTKHACFVADEHLCSVDFKFFEWSEEFAASTNPAQKLVMEVPYMGLVKAGFSRENLRGQEVQCMTAWAPQLDSQMGQPPNYLLPYWLGTKGKNCIIDTACSAALTAANMCHGEIAMGRSHLSFISGINTGIDVGAFIALSGARMISDRGRSFTFDQSGNGYGRGEGVCMVVLEPSGIYNPIRAQCKQTEPWELVRFVGSATNQDGRSASITAPSGPAQTACIRKSLLEAMLSPPEIAFGECHGTGTALGDPIEVGSARITNDPFIREFPMIMGATKTHFGHLELGAGCIGLMRAIVVLCFGTATPNANLYQVNEHMSLEGFPHIMACEAGKFPFENNIAGVSSFGFGGTNTRAELWGRKTVEGCSGLMSPETKKIKNETEKDLADRFDKVDFVTKQCPKCLGLMSWIDGRAIPSKPFYSGRYHNSMIREDAADYDICSYCYEGEYQYRGQPVIMELPNAGYPVFMMGSWSNWSACEEMTQVEPGVYACAVRLGVTRREEFRLSTSSTISMLSIHPIADKSRSCIRIEGPDRDGTGKNWLIDGWADGSPEGTVYRVLFSWTTEGVKAISWEPTEEMMPDLRALVKPTYYIVGATAEDSLDVMTRDPEDPDKWVSKLYGLPGNGKMNFHFVQNGAIEGQDIYPIVPAVKIDGNKPEAQVSGPDGARGSRSFQVHGYTGSKVQVHLHAADGIFSVTAAIAGSKSASMDGGWKKTWKSTARRYALSGTFYDNGGKIFLEPDSDDPSIHRGRFRMGSESESFQVLVDGDAQQVLYPEIDGSMPGESILCGPANGVSNSWQIGGAYGVDVEVIVSVNEMDMRHVVLCRAVSGQ